MDLGEWALVAGATCPVCVVFKDQSADCVGQTCTSLCQFDEDCPDGYVCTCLGASFAGTPNQICLKADPDGRRDWRSLLSCL
ncbi:MAG: hypothetical protein AUK47_03570 [Deltaproteobacteria bacterium CG2_30_63_29]|nr:MAG: hypothetical protein AUK47_03570 [Deltaproteobacteria bacterium CG2_30_63_29]